MTFNQPHTVSEHIDRLSKGLIRDIEMCREEAQEYRKRAAELDARADALRNTLDEWNRAREVLANAPIPFVPAEVRS